MMLVRWSALARPMQQCSRAGFRAICKRDLTALKFEPLFGAQANLINVPLMLATLSLQTMKSEDQLPGCRFPPRLQVDTKTSPNSKLDSDGSVGSKFKSDGKVCQAKLRLCH